MTGGTCETSVDVTVVGDGLVGLSSAYHLLRQGYRVCLVSEERSGRASTAAAGMLTPACEFDPWMIHQLLDLLEAGKAYYPEFLSGWTTEESVDFRRTDFTLVDVHERLELLSDRMEWMPGLGFDVEWLEPADVCQLEPNLSPAAFRGGIRVKDEAVVNPIALWEALGAEVTRLGVQGHVGGAVGFDSRGGRVITVTGDGQQVTSEKVVLAAGSWSQEVGLLAGLDVPVCPVKGQMILLHGPEHMINSVVYMPSGGCGSVVERKPGHYVVGTSEEYLGPVADNTAGVVGSILHRLCTVLPAASEWTIETTWAGFRPMTADELPIIGAVPGSPFVVAAGHHRNGVLLSPITGRLVADVVSGAAPSGVDLAPFAYGREQRPYARFASKY